MILRYSALRNVHCRIFQTKEGFSAFGPLGMRVDDIIRLVQLQFSSNSAPRRLALHRLPVEDLEKWNLRSIKAIRCSDEKGLEFVWKITGVYEILR